MSSNHAPTSSAELIRLHSTARYLTVNETEYRGYHKVSPTSGEGIRLAEASGYALARKQF
jgi:hypothetical protein